jgi:signal transduction histidine kinase
MPVRLNPWAWPITAKVPLAVAALMVLVGIVLSERVLGRLAETQERHLRELAQSYLDGLSSSVAPSILRDDSWEVFDAIERARELNKGLHPLEAIVTNADGAVIAASNPRRHPVGSLVRPPADREAAEQLFRFDAGADTASAVRKLSYPGRTVGIIYATFDTRHLAAERRDILLALVVTNGAVTLLLAVGGWFLVARMMRPVRILSQHLGAARAGAARPIDDHLATRVGGEFGSLFRAYNGLVHSMEERELLAKRLAAEERLGSLGRLTSALAHEINNPLGGLFNALATLKAHGHVASARISALGLLDRGLVGIRDVVRTTLALYRADAAPRDLKATDVDDLGLLIAPEARRKSVQVSVDNRIGGSIALPSTPVRQAILNLLLNAVAAAPVGSTVELSACIEGTHLIVSVSDRGAGLPRAGASILLGKSDTLPLREGGGLGLWTTRRVVSDLGGRVDVEWPDKGGTAIRLMIPLRKSEELPHVA